MFFFYRIMYEKEVQKLSQWFEEVPSDLESFSDSDDSVADPLHENISDHES